MIVTVKFDTDKRCRHCDRTMFYSNEDEAWKCPTYLLFDNTLLALADFNHGNGRQCKFCGGPMWWYEKLAIWLCASWVPKHPDKIVAERRALSTPFADVVIEMYNTCWEIEK